MTDIKDQLKRAAEPLGLSPDETALQRFQIYFELLLDWNEKMNLTAITDPSEIVCKHFADSISLLSVYSPGAGASLADVGTGAGFPGVPLKILREDISLVLIDSLQKRLAFLNALCERLGLSAEMLHFRAEECGQNPFYREKFDLVTARAVSSLPSLCEYCLPLVKRGGCFAAFKGPNLSKELEDSKAALSLLGAGETVVRKVLLPEETEHAIALIYKERHTPTQYPRRGVKIAKNPL